MERGGGDQSPNLPYSFGIEEVWWMGGLHTVTALTSQGITKMCLFVCHHSLVPANDVQLVLSMELHAISSMSKVRSEHWVCIRASFRFTKGSWAAINYIESATSDHDFLMNFSWLCHTCLMTSSWPSHDFLMSFSWFAYDFFIIVIQSHPIFLQISDINGKTRRGRPRW